MNEVLVEGAASMSGQAAKEIAGSLIGGAIGEATAQKRKIRRKLQRKMFKNKFKQSSVTVDPKEIKTKVLKDDLQEDIKVGKPVHIKQPKTSSSFKMKGFSGFGNKK